MSGQLGRRWSGIRDSLWFIPGLMTAAAALLATGLVELDSRVSRSVSLGGTYFAFGGGVEGARGVLTAIASTTVTVTGVVFSLTIVTLQLAASQFSPRVLRSFSRDRVSHVTMGAFLGSFTYALLVLRNVRSGADDGETFVPAIAVGVAILMVLASTSLLIYYIHHVARSIQASPLIDRITDDANAAVRRLFPEPVGEAAPDPSGDATRDGPPGLVAAVRAGYLQAVDEDALFSLAGDEGSPRLTLRMEPLVGEFILPGAPLVTVWPATAAAREDVRQAVRHAFTLGSERTLQHDAGFGIRQLADIAIKALSPGINDPTTAETCIDRLAEVLVNLGSRRPPNAVRRGKHDSVRFIANELNFPAAVNLAFAQVRHYASGDASVLVHLLVIFGRIGTALPPHLRPVLETQVRVTLTPRTRGTTAGGGDGDHTRGRTGKRRAVATHVSGGGPVNRSAFRRYKSGCLIGQLERWRRCSPVAPSLPMAPLPRCSLAKISPNWTSWRAEGS